MLRPEGGICPLRNGGTCGRVSRVCRVVSNGLLCNDGSVGPAYEFPITSNHAPRSMLLKVLDAVVA